MVRDPEERAQLVHEPAGDAGGEHLRLERRTRAPRGGRPSRAPRLGEGEGEATESAELDESPEPAGTVDVTVPSKPVGSQSRCGRSRDDAGDEATPAGLDLARVVAAVGGDVDPAGQLFGSGTWARPFGPRVPVTTHSRSMASGRQNPSL